MTRRVREILASGQARFCVRCGRRIAKGFRCKRHETQAEKRMRHVGPVSQKREPWEQCRREYLADLGRTEP